MLFRPKNLKIFRNNLSKIDTKPIHRKPQNTAERNYRKPTNIEIYHAHGLEDLSLRCELPPN